MGMGSSSGGSTTTVQITPEQRALLGAQTKFLTETAFPAYGQTVQGAKEAYMRTAPYATAAAEKASELSGQTAETQQAAGTAGTAIGMSNLAQLFSPEYKQQQINAALQSGREAGRELVNAQNASYGGAGGLGSARKALADANLASLQEQRQGTVAATTAGQIEQNRALAANQLATLGLQNLTGAQQAATNRVALAGTPQDIYNKYASVVYGIPQGNTTPNFTGTQGSTTTGSAKGFGISKGS